jgi:hypothetical protein
MHPYINNIFDSRFNTDWHMVPSERAAMLYLLQKLRPKTSIELGTFLGGSLRPISAFSDKVYTFDIYEKEKSFHKEFPNVKFMAGDSAVTLPKVIEKINKSKEELNFVLIDGSHETYGVLEDVKNILNYVPKKNPCIIVMHDSANPAVRKGLMDAPWEDCKYAQGVNFDFVNGALYDRPDIKNEVWGGLGIAVMTPEPRKGDFIREHAFGYTLHMIESAIKGQ